MESYRVFLLEIIALCGQAKDGEQYCEQYASYYHDPGKPLVWVLSGDGIAEGELFHGVRVLDNELGMLGSGRQIPRTIS